MIEIHSSMMVHKEILEIACIDFQRVEWNILEFRGFQSFQSKVILE